MAGKAGANGKATVIIRREEVVEGGHHGGAWKVAYADFVTAMMAFFLLMWLLNATTEDQRKGLADYFTPSNALSHASSGSGAPFGGHTPYDQGHLVSDRGAQSGKPGTAQAEPDADDPDSESAPSPAGAHHDPRTTRGEQPEDATGNAIVATTHDGAKASGGGTASISARSPAQALGKAEALANAGSGVNTPAPTAAAAAIRAEQERREHAAFEQATQQIRDAIRNDPALASLASQLAIDETPEGLRIQLLDEDRQPMFATGSVAMNDRARLLLQKIGPVLARLTENIAVSGHTDAAPYKGTDKTNWELSSERANATRRLLVESGLQEARFRSVSGNADRDLLLPADPLAAANRRIAIVVLRSAKPGR